MGAFDLSRGTEGGTEGQVFCPNQTRVYNQRGDNMARRARLMSKSGIYHIMLRGINKQNIFEDSEDRYKLLDILLRFKKQDKFNVYGYCLMSNHVHILIKEVEDPISVAIKRISSSYVLWFNKKYARTGHLFQERFKSEPVENEGYFITVLRYIHRNPINAGIVDNFLKTKWTSYYDYIRVRELIDVDYALDIFSTNRNVAIDLYKKYMQEDNNDQCLDINERVMLNDEEVISYMKSLGVSSVSALQQMNTEDRNKILKKIKGLKTVSLRQLSRITGVSKSVLGRI